MEEKGKEELDYYSIDRISNSALSKFESVGPAGYKLALDYGYKEESKSLDLGDAIHTNILEPDKFDSKFTICDSKKVEGSMGTFIELISKQFKRELEELGSYATLSMENDRNTLERLNNEAGFKQSIDTTWKTFQKSENQQYLQFLLSTDGKYVISKYTNKIIQNCINNIYKHKAVIPLLQEEPHTITYNELPIMWQLFHIELKSKIDRLVIDNNNKTITIVDLKTTGFNPYNFITSYKKYKYYRQLAFYKHAVQYWIEKVYPEYIEYAIDIKFIVSHTSGSNECVVFNPSKEDINTGINEYKKLLMDLYWHIDTGNWDYERSYYESNGIVELSLEDNGLVEEKEEIENGEYKEK